MKSFGIFFIFFWVFIFPQVLFAENIISGNQTAETRVINNVNNGNITNHIETIINGQKTIIETHEPGTVSIKNINGTVTISKTPKDMNIKQQIASSSSIIDTKTYEKNFIVIFIETVSDIFLKLIRFF